MTQTPETDRVKICADGVMPEADYRRIASLHGGRYPAGTMLGYKALLLAQELLCPDGVLTRGRFSVETAFTGLGFKDAVEMALRAPSMGLYSIDPDMPVPSGSVPAPGGGFFFYRFVQDDGMLELAVKPGLVPQGFYRATDDLASGKIKDEAEVLKIRRDIEKALAGLSPHEIFDVLSCRACAVRTEYAEPPGLEDDFRLLLDDFAEYEVSAEDARFFHGDDSLCGLCLFWSLVRQWARGENLQGRAIPRRRVSVKIGARGKGVDDACEFLFRTSDGRSSVDLEWGKTLGAPEVMPGEGYFAFSLGLDGQRHKAFALKDDMVPRDYLRLCNEMAANPADFRGHGERKKLQRDFARHLLSEPEPFRAVS